MILLSGMSDIYENNSGHEVMEIRVDIPRLYVDVVSDYIIEHLSHGLVLEDTEDTDTVGIIFYVPTEKESQSVQQLQNYLDTICIDNQPFEYSFNSKAVNRSDWEEQYRKSIQPVFIGDDIVVRPPWIELDEQMPFDIIIEPKMAFGTGRHETTTSCLRVIRQRFQAGMSFLDVGCGSGILSILADKLQAGCIKAIDYDMTAVDNCRENFTINGVNSPHEIICGTIEQCREDKPYEFVCANIIKTTILEILSELCRLTAEHGILLLSGLLERDLDEITRALQQQGQKNYTIISEGEWRTVVVEKL